MAFRDSTGCVDTAAPAKANAPLNALRMVQREKFGKRLEKQPLDDVSPARGVIALSITPDSRTAARMLWRFARCHG